MEYHIYSDGSCINNGLPSAIASWSYLVTDSKGNVIEACTGKIKGPQNSNRAELVAFIKSLGFVARTDRRSTFVIHVDYEAIYLYCNGKSNPKSNLDLYKEINRKLLQCKDREIEVVKVKAHTAGDSLKEFLNDTVDSLAKKTCLLFKKQLAN